jgi:hypothetical protein|tara:strand:- start:1782 stop:2774 length:993 start_codon:yes stop_codon:yes gene_type:complete
MALTLVEATKYSNDVLQKGVVELLVKDDPILEKLPFKDIKGNGLTYNEETTLSGAQFYEVGDTWVESTSTVTSRTAVTTILGGDADVDNFLKATRSNEQDLMKEQIAAKTKAIRRAYLDAFFYGYFTGGGTKDFDGLHYLIRRTTAGSNNAIAVATSSGTALALSLERVEAAIDLVKGDKPDLVVMSKLMRRSINKYLNGVGGITKTDVQGKTVQTLFDLPVVVSDHIRDNESADLQYGTNEGAANVYGHNYADGAGDDDDGATSIFVLRFASDACCGIQSLPITTDRIGNLETKDAQRVRIKWYPGLMFQKLISCSKVTGADANGVVTA